MAKKTAKLVKKRCAKCGTVQSVRPRVRRCKHQAFGPRGYCCWGKLERVTRRRAHGVEDNDENSMIVGDGTTTTLVRPLFRRPQEIAQSNLVASMTDDEIATQTADNKRRREERAQRRQKSRRSIDLTL